MEQLFDFPSLPPLLSKKAFSQHLGLSPGRINQLIEQGLPVEPNGRIDPAKAEPWYRSNVSSHRRPAMDAPSVGARAQLDRVRVERERLKLDKERRDVVDRQAAERTVFARARAERDAWIGWTSRASALLAADIGADPAALFASLDRLVREQLAMLAEQPLEDLLK